MTAPPTVGRHLTTVHNDEPPPDDYGPTDWTPPTRNGHDRLPPQDRDAERSVLGGMLLSPQACDDAIEAVTAPEFYTPAHELIFTAITNLHLAGEPADTITVADHLTRQGDLKRVGGHSYLAELVASVPTAANAGYYADIVATKAALRRLVQAGTRIVQLGHAEGDADVADIINAGTLELTDAARLLPGNRTTQAASTWAPVNLENILDGTHTSPTATLFQRRDGKNLFYRASVHSISGEPGSGKTWALLIAVAQELEAGHDVLFIDFEDRASSVVNRLLQLGVHPDNIANAQHQQLRYVRPENALDHNAWAALKTAAQGCTLAGIDGITEAMTMHSLSLMDNEDVAKWLELIPRRLADLGDRDQGPAVVQIDHVVKNADNRGRYAIGGQHKLAGITGVAYKMLTIRSFGKGVHGHAKLVVDKDKHGDVGPNGITAADIHLDATDRTGTLYGWVDTPEQSHDEDGQFRPTTLMQRVSDFLLVNAGPQSLNAIKKGVKGNDESKAEAVFALVREGHVITENGPRGATMHRLVTAFKDE